MNVLVLLGELGHLEHYLKNSWSVACLKLLMAKIYIFWLHGRAVWRTQGGLV